MMQFSLPFLILSIFFFIIFLVVGIFHYKNKFNIDYDLRNMFPFEINYNGSFSDNLFGNISLILSAIFAICFYITFDVKFDNALHNFFASCGAISFVLMTLIYFLPIKYFKPHLATLIGLFALSFSSAALVSTSAYQMRDYILNPSPVVLSIIGAIVTIFILALIFNPRLTPTIKYETNNKNEKVRPKFIVIAFSEWLLFFTNYLVLILAFILIAIR